MDTLDNPKISPVLVGFVFLSFANISMAGVCRFQALGDLPGGDFFSKAYAVSGDGTVVVGEGHSTSGTEAFRWTPSDRMQGLGDLSGGNAWSEAYGVSPDGSVIVGSSKSASGPEAFRWENGLMTGLGDLPGGFFQSLAYGVSADGAVVVGESESALETEAFRWTQAGGMVGLGGLLTAVPHSKARAVSADGLFVVGGSASPLAVEEAFRWTQADGMVALGFLGVDPGAPLTAISSAFAVSADGSVVVGSSTSAFGGLPFRWENGVMTGLGIRGTATAVSADGSVIVGRAFFVDRTYEPFIWDMTHGVRSLRSVLVDDCGLDLGDWALERATGISADGLTIVGYGTNPDGLTEGWIATIPEPATLLLLGLGGLALLRKHATSSPFNSTTVVPHRGGGKESGPQHCRRQSA